MARVHLNDHRRGVVMDLKWYLSDKSWNKILCLSNMQSKLIIIDILSFRKHIFAYQDQMAQKAPDILVAFHLLLPHCNFFLYFCEGFVRRLNFFGIGRLSENKKYAVQSKFRSEPKLTYTHPWSSWFYVIQKTTTS